MVSDPAKAVSHTTQSLLSPGAGVRIRKKYHHLGGEFASFRDFFWRKDEPWLVLRSLTRPRFAIPLSGTFLTPDCLPKPSHPTELLPAALVELGRLVHTLHTRSRPAPRTGKRSPRRT